MMDDATTKPMLETLLSEFREFRAEAEGFMTRTGERLERIETELDRVRAVAHETRADVRELRTQLREAMPTVVK